MTIQSSQTISLRRVLIASALGLGVSLLSLAPPIIHFVSGPLGPAIGGLVATIQLKPQAGERALIGAGMGLLAGVLAVVILVGLDAAGLLLMALPVILLVAFGIAAYVAALGTAGAFLAGRLNRQG